MNIDTEFANMQSGMSRAAAAAEVAMNSDVTNNPEALLAAQQAWAAYNVDISYYSSEISTLKNMMMGVIQNIS